MEGLKEWGKSMSSICLKLEARRECDIYNLINFLMKHSFRTISKADRGCL
jgi:hypothetical protein